MIYNLWFSICMISMEEDCKIFLGWLWRQQVQFLRNHQHSLCPFHLTLGV